LRENTRYVLAVAAITLVVAVGYGAMAARRGRSDHASAGVLGNAAAARAYLGTSPALMFSDQIGEASAHLSFVPLSGFDGTRAFLPLRCLRLYFAGGRGLCLSADAGVGTAFEMYVLDSSFKVVRTLPLTGLPSRTRVSADGRYGATTVYVAGHSYSNGDFSTETTLFDLARGKKLANLEDFTVLRDGQPLKAADFNFWGVTFAPDGNRFYATLKTGGRTYLVEGDIAARQMRIRYSNVECPSLSPDGTRIAYKKAVAVRRGVIFWRFTVLDLRTMTETPLAEERSIDDQVEWLDSNAILYGLLSDVWMVPADGSGEPRRFLNRAASPVVMRSAVATLLPAEAQTVTPPSADLGVKLTAEDNAPRIGEDFHYTLTVSNRGPEPATVTEMDIRLSPAVTVTSYVPANPAMPYGCSVQEGYFNCTIERLKPAESWTMDLVVQSNAAGVLRHEARVTGAQPDANRDNNRSIAEVQVKP